MEEKSKTKKNHWTKANVDEATKKIKFTHYIIHYLANQFNKNLSKNNTRHN